MFKLIKKEDGQAAMGEYVFTFFIAVAFITAMTVYMKRSVQGRYLAVRNKMVNDVANRTTGYYNDGFFVEYEPYYVHRVGTRYEDNFTEKRLREGVGGGAGIFTKDIDEWRGMRIFSETAPPRNADREFGF